MAHQIVQVEIEEWALILDLLDAAHKLRLRSTSGDYTGALADTPQAKELRTDLSALIKTAKAARPSDS